MSQAYKVTQAFQATVSKEDKTPKVIEFNGHTFNAWKVKLDGQADKGWINVNKKPGNEIKPGDELYGDIATIEGHFGVFYNFKSASRPLGERPAVAPSQSIDDGEGSVHEKLDYIIGLLEELADNPLAGAQKVDLADLDI